MKRLVAMLILSFSFVLGSPVVASASALSRHPTSTAATCVFEAGVVQSCQSTNPHIVLNLHNTGDTSQCIFAIQVNWGDGRTEDFTVRGGPDGSEYLSDHVYPTRPDAYLIEATGSVQAGPCTFTSASYQFTLLPAPCPEGGMPVGVAGATPDYCTPPDWNTKYAKTLTPGVEPLNIIISARSTVRLDAILRALKAWNGWDVVTTGNPPHGCLSPEEAQVYGHNISQQEASWRLEGCKNGNTLSLFGEENHARLWNQPVPGSDFGAWFITASYETACVRRNGHFKPLRNRDGSYNVGEPWHCIDGGEGSYGSHGYDQGAANLANDIAQATRKKGWYAWARLDTRPVGIGEDGVAFGSTVYVVTVDYDAPTA